MKHKEAKMNGVQSLNRMLDILEYVAENGRPCSLSEITEKTGLPKSTACRIASVLEERGYAAKDSDTGRYIPGLKILSIAGAVLDSLDAAKTAHPFLRELSDKTAETVHLLACDGDYAVYIDKIEYPNTIKLDSQIGKRVPLYCTAAGKALLSQRSEKEIRAYLERTELVSYTRNTITDPALLIEELERIRKKGYSVDNIEYEENVRCVGAPVMNYAGAPAAAISISGPTIRVKQKDVPFLAEAIMDTSGKISRSLGYSPRPGNI